MKLKLITKIKRKAPLGEDCHLQLLANGKPIISGPEDEAMAEMEKFYKMLKNTNVNWEQEKGQIIHE